MTWERTENTITIILNEKKTKGQCPICLENSMLFEITKKVDKLVMKLNTQETHLCKRCRQSLVSAIKLNNGIINNDIYHARHGPLLPKYNFIGSKCEQSYMPEDKTLFDKIASMKYDLINKMRSHSLQTLNIIHSYEDCVEYFEINDLLNVYDFPNIYKEGTREYNEFSKIKQTLEPYLEKKEKTINYNKLEEISIVWLINIVKKLS